jgi:hypothetical protein
MNEQRTIATRSRTGHLPAPSASSVAQAGMPHTLPTQRRSTRLTGNQTTAVQVGVGSAPHTTPVASVTVVHAPWGSDTSEQENAQVRDPVNDEC